MKTENNPPLRLPPGHVLHPFNARQAAAPGAIYLALMPGDLETLFGPVRALRDREFLLQVDGQQWLATPAPDLFVSYDDEHHVMAFDTGGIHAQTNSEMTSIDFELLRPA